MKNFLLLMMFSISVLMTGCTKKENPIEKLALQNNHYPEYSIVLIDMRETPEKAHKYKILTGKPTDPKNVKDLTFTQKTTGWIEVPDDVYDKYLSDLGMVLLSKRNGKVSGLPQPPGYNKVGDQQYGQWKKDDNGNSFWAFYGQYMFFSHMLGGMNSPHHIYRNDYRTYRYQRQQGRPYYGRTQNGKTKYGTGGSVTSRSNSSFVQRWNNKSAAQKSRFQKRVQAKRNSQRSFSTRVKAKSQTRGRSSMSRTRSRSGRAGK